MHCKGYFSDPALGTGMNNKVIEKLVFLIDQMVKITYTSKPYRISKN